MNNLLYVRDFIDDTTKGITPDYVASSNVVVLNQKCIRNNKIDYGFAQYHNPNKSFSESKILKVGDILINSTGQGTAGRCAFVSELPNDKTVITDSHILIIRTGDFYTAGCLEYSLFSIEQKLQTFMDGSTGQGEFDKQRLFNVLTSIPKEEQRESVFKLLRKIDDAIDVNDEITSELDKMVKTLYDYWFVQYEFPNKNGKPYKSSGGSMVYNDELKRDIPLGWDVRDIQDVATVVRGASPRPIDDYISDEGLPWIKISDATSSDNRFILGTKQFIKDEGRTKTRVLPKDKLILSNSATPGIPRITKIELGIHDGWLLIDNFKMGMTIEFLFQFFLNERPRIVSLGNGSIFKNLKTEYIKGVKIAVPPEDIIERISPTLESINKRIYLSEKTSSQLIEMRNWLIPILMTGQAVLEVK